MPINEAKKEGVAEITISTFGNLNIPEQAENTKEQ
jgi:hypothetical protein